MNGNQTTVYLKTIHTAKRDVGLDDATYRALLEGAAGVTSAKDIVSTSDFKKVMHAFDVLGRKPKTGLFSTRWACAPGQQSMILALWLNVGHDQHERALSAFVKRIAKVDTPRFLTKELATEVIIALKTMDAERIRKEINSK
ncbi:MAG: hypothetical protein A2Y38_20215 [Spirochaetes bacterium GWB1_59_5]|nr:MAG: hypothetical protein A2Y38_20215 [Spirochaetes bacterium GWB1_59_5]